MEHRWLHNTFGEVPEKKYTVPIGKAKVIKQGSDVTIVAHSYMSIEALKGAMILENHGVNCEVIDLRSLRPLDVNTIITSVKKTRRLLVVDNGWTRFGVSAEIISSVAEEIFSDLKSAPKRIGIEDVPIPSTRALAVHSYPTPSKIINAVSDLMEVVIDLTENEKKQDPSDIPDQSFTGPF